MMGVFVQIKELGCRGPWAGMPIGYVLQENGCWDWVGSKDRHGYGRLWENKRARPAHRVMYERQNGPIPEAFHLDHLCRNPSCVNPSHLEPVTPTENKLRGCGPTAINARKTHCIRGHELVGDNLLAPAKSKKARNCRTCYNANKRALRAQRNNR